MFLLMKDIQHLAYFPKSESSCCRGSHSLVDTGRDGSRSVRRRYSRPRFQQDLAGDVYLGQFEGRHREPHARQPPIALRLELQCIEHEPFLTSFAQSRCEGPAQRLTVAMPMCASRILAGPLTSLAAYCHGWQY